jgi:hypothetical protein
MLEPLQAGGVARGGALEWHRKPLSCRRGTAGQKRACAAAADAVPRSPLIDVPATVALVCASSLPSNRTRHVDFAELRTQRQ